MVQHKQYLFSITCTKFVATLTKDSSLVDDTVAEDEVAACVVKIDGQAVILLDPPGPDYRDDKEAAFDAIAVWLSKKAK